MFNIPVRKLAAVAGALVGVGCAMLAGIAMAAEVKEDISVNSQLGNRYVQFIIGNDGAIQPKTPPASHGYYEAILPIGGRFGITRNEGNPLTPDDNNKQILAIHPDAFGAPVDRMNFWAVQIDDGKKAWTKFPTGDWTGLIGAFKNGSWTLFPYMPDNRRMIRARTVMDKTPIQVDLEARVLHDTIKFKWTFTNTGNETTPMTHYVSLKLLADVCDGVTDLMGISSDGNPRFAIDGQPLLTSDTVLKGPDVPDTLEFLDDSSNPTKTGRFTFRGEGATPPDVVGVGDWGVLSSAGFSYVYPDVFLYEPLNHYSLAGMDDAVSALWRPVPLAVNKSFTVITYIGCADATSRYTTPSEADPQYTASVHGPRTLRYDDTSGSAVPFAPYPFTVAAYVDSEQLKLDLTDVSFTLSLPKGLVLDESESGGLTKTVSRVAPLGTGGVEWKVRPDGTAYGRLSYSVSFTAAPVGGTSINRTIQIPATVKSYLSQKWQMLSVPYQLTANTDAPPPGPGSSNAPNDLTVLGIDGDYGADWRVWAYNSNNGQYYQPDHLEQGRAYWVFMKDAGKTTNADFRWIYKASDWVGTSGKTIALERGWNLIGNPYVYGVTMGQLFFFHPDYGLMTYDEAMERNLVSRSVYWYDSRYRDYSWGSDRTVELKPWAGYWVKALQPNVHIVISPESQVGAVVKSTGTSGGGPPPAP